MSDLTAPAIAVLDYRMGNRRSVEKAFERVGAAVVVTGDNAAIRAADGLVLPGVGAFPRGMANLRELGLDAVIGERVTAGTPLLGICLGMQLLFDGSNELGGARGLGLIDGEVTRLDGGGLRIPHIGWNEVRFERASALTAGLKGGGAAFYHVHSFVARPTEPADVVGTAEYGERFASVVARGSVFGVQFHPEKSSRDGLELLRSFVGLVA
jgi:glutamine amidotransferase